MSVLSREWKHIERGENEPNSKIVARQLNNQLNSMRSSAKGRGASDLADNSL